MDCDYEKTASKKRATVMTPEAWVQLIEEMMDLKIQHFAESTMKVSSEVSKILQDKRETDRRRLDQIRTELVRTLKA